MKPILFPSTATEFKTQGLGVLTDAISCTVTEERNGAFELTMQYPDTGVHFDEITDRCIIYAIPSPYRAPQPFRIYRITRPMDGIIMVYAQHITYDLSGVPLNPFTAINAPDALSKLKLNAAVDSPFTFWTDKSTVASFAVSTPSSTRSVLGGSSGSILDVYGGEYEWDGFTVRLYGHRGYDNGVVISYGKNLTDIEQDRNISNVATGIYPYWTNAEGALVTCDPKIVDAPGTYDFTRVVPVDFSNDFEAQPTSEQLQARAEKYVEANKIGIPKTSITASFVQLEQFPEYEDLALLEKCDLCDTVTIRYPQLGVEAKAEIVKIETDVLLERYNSVEIGDVRTNIADTIVGQQQEIKQKPSETYLREAVLALTETILGASGGAVRLLDTNNDGMPDTLYIADDPDPTKARKSPSTRRAWIEITNSLQINVIIYRLFNILLHLDCINGRAVNARVAVCAGIVLASKAHPTKPTAALDMYAAVYKADGRAYLYAVDLLAVNARVAVCTRAAVFDLREPTAALEMNAIINIAVFGIDFKSFHRLSKVARVVLAVFYLREPMAPRVCGIRQIARAGGLWLTRLGCRL